MSREEEEAAAEWALRWRGRRGSWSKGGGSLSRRVMMVGCPTGEVSMKAAGGRRGGAKGGETEVKGGNEEEDNESGEGEGEKAAGGGGGDGVGSRRQEVAREGSWSRGGGAPLAWWWYPVHRRSEEGGKGRGVAWHGVNSRFRPRGPPWPEQARNNRREIMEEKKRRGEEKEEGKEDSGKNVQNGE